MTGRDDGAPAAGARAARPPWLAEPCPPWCTRAHAADDHPEDRYHQSEPSIVPVVAGAADAVPVTTSLRAMTLTVRLGRYAGDERTWLLIEPLEDLRPRMVLAADDARALLQALHGQLAALTRR